MTRWKLVPVEATGEQVDAGESARLENTDVYFDGSEVARDVPIPIYTAMLSAAPAPDDAVIETVAKVQCRQDYPDMPREWHDENWREWQDAAREVIAALLGEQG